jgi:hypothetical protein
MTIAAGFHCDDGVVLCTDSQHTVGQSKFYDEKIYTALSKNGIVCVAGAGDSEHIKYVTQEIAKNIEGKNPNIDQINLAIDQVVSKTFSSHFAPIRQSGDPNPPTFVLIVAVQLNRETHLLKVRETGSVSEVEHLGLAVTGTEAGESVFRALADILLMHDVRSVYAVCAIAAYLIRSVGKFSAYCGGSPQLACFADDGSRWIHTIASDDPGIDPLANIFSGFPLILEACARGSIGGFKHGLERLESDLREVMENRKKHQERYPLPSKREWIW